jgi:hypothetical protein
MTYNYSFICEGLVRTDSIHRLDVGLALPSTSKSASPRQRIKIPSCARAVRGRRNTVHLWLSGQSQSWTMHFVSPLYIRHISYILSILPVPVQERLDLMEWHFSKMVGLMLAMAQSQHINPSTIKAFNAPPPLPQSLSPSAQSGSSPGLGVSALALSDTHSTTSTHSSVKLDKPGMFDILLLFYDLCIHST